MPSQGAAFCKGAGPFAVGLASHGAALGGRPRRPAVDQLGRGRFPSRGATLDIDFVNWQAYVYGIGLVSPQDLLTVSGSGGTRVSEGGVLVPAAALRRDYDPVSNAGRGLLVEEQRTNAIRNNTATGAITGTPGTAPTNWGIPTPWDGLARQIVGTGVETGIAYIDVRYSGTITTGNSAIALALDASAAQTAAAAQTWTQSVYLRLVAGSFANVASLTINPRDYDSGAALVENLQGSNLTGTITGAPLIGQRYTFSSVLTGATIVSVQANLRLLSGTAGQAVDFTLRIGLPQLELSAFATSPILTSGTAVTRTADSVNMTGTNFSSWFNPLAGTFVTEHFYEGAGAAGVTRVIEVHDGSASNRIVVGDTGTGARGIVTTAASSQYDITVSYGSPVPRKSALSFQASDIQVAAAGALGTAGAAGTLPNVNQLSIGGSATGVFGGVWVRRVRFFPPRQPNASLQSLTT